MCVSPTARRGPPGVPAGDGLAENRMSSALNSPGEDAVDETSDVLDSDLPGIPGLRPIVVRNMVGLSERPKLAIVSGLD